ncbi:MAG: sigma-54 dependent transcriptional regulator [Thermodesulfobacteriota bacterium]|nr:sigma-54 dependent transcriptional regulator [Thermodesulfobacteriota bacterium]
MNARREETKNAAILVVDDDKNMCTYLETVISLMHYRVESVGSGKDALDCIRSGKEFSAIILDIMMPEMDGITTLQKIRELDSDIPIIILSALGQIQTIVKAMKAGASDYINKPFDDEELKIGIENVLENRRLVEEVRALKKELEEERREHFVSASEHMAEIKNLIEKIASTDIPVLIQGESGVGKEIVARSIYSNSFRKDKPFIKVSCVALPGQLLESELFGYEKGAFTGAHISRPGRFELAHEATIFLDEIGDMLPSLQGKLLQVLQDGVFTRLGASEDTRVNVRVLAATNVELEKAVREGVFREDLYHRLSVINIKVPPLRKRKEDIPILLDHFLGKYNQKYQRSLDSLSEDFVNACMAYDWPGNVRELENVVRRVVVLRDEGPVLSEFASEARKLTEKPSDGRHSSKETSGRLSLRQVSKRTVIEVEKEMILETLKQTRWNKKKAAERLGVNYKTLLYKLKKIGEYEQ